MSNTLNHWTTRVADIKFRELEVNQKVERAMLVYVVLNHEMVRLELTPLFFQRGFRQVESPLYTACGRAEFDGKLSGCQTRRYSVHASVP